VDTVEILSFKNSFVCIYVILKWIFRKGEGEGGMDWIDLAQDRDRWQAVVNEVMKLQVP
jgi:hypothetical protein